MKNERLVPPPNSSDYREIPLDHFRPYPGFHTAFDASSPDDAALLDSNHTNEGDTIPGGRAVGRDAAREYMRMYVNAFPDLQSVLCAG